MGTPEEPHENAKDGVQLTAVEKLSDKLDHYNGYRGDFQGQTIWF